MPLHKGETSESDDHIANASETRRYVMTNLLKPSLWTIGKDLPRSAAEANTTKVPRRKASVRSTSALLLYKAE